MAKIVVITDCDFSNTIQTMVMYHCTKKEIVVSWNNSISQRTKTLEEKFWEKVDIRGEDECWEWQAARNRKGYGNFYISIGHSKDKHFLAHRMAYKLSSKKEIGSGMLICHTCDNPPCCNPKHLFEGTVLDNTLDMMKKGRSYIQKGGKPNLKLTQEKANEIRRLRNEQRVPLKTLASMFSIDVSWVVKISKGYIWKGE